jgi:dihydrofolate reductase
MSVPAIPIHGYAIVSDDDRIADAEGGTPRSLRNDADWAIFQSELDRADLIALGRLGHEANPNVRRRRRVVLSHAAAGLERRADAWWWDPAKTPWSEASAQLLPSGGRVAVPGGQRVFDLFLGIGYDAFHLTRAHGVRLGAGRRLFSACDAGMSAEAVLRGAGLGPDPPVTVDAKADVALTVWRRRAPAAAVRTATPWPA